jgi:hypothetical protein
VIGEGAAAAAGDGAGAVAVRDGVESEAEEGKGIPDGVGGGIEIFDGGAEVTAPFSRLTSFGGAVFPVKNSPALRDGSIEGAGG